MAKKGKRSRRQSPPIQKSSAPSFASFNFEKYANIGIIALLVILIYSQFFEFAVQGKRYNAADATAGSYAASFVDDYIKDGVYPQWTPYLFGGMPCFGSGISATRIYPVLSFYRYVMPSFLARIFEMNLLHYLLGALGMFLLLRHLKVGRTAALFSAIAFLLMPHFIGLIPIAHGGKLHTIAYIPLAFFAILRILEKPSLYALAFGGLVLGFQLLAQHPQIAYYTLWMLFFLTIYWIVIELSRKNFKVLIGGSLCAGAVILAMMMSFIMYGPMAEYSKYSIRGAPPALDTESPKTGLSYDYANSWSFPPEEIITFFAPGFYGVGEQGGLYWGQMPFTQTSLYMGILPLILAGIAVAFRRNRITIFLLIVAIASLLASFGRHFPLLSKFLLDYLPYYNKFRVPAMVQVLLEFSVIALAGIGLQVLLDQAKDIKNKITPARLKILSNVLIGLIVVSLLVGVVFLFGGQGLFKSLKDDGMFWREKDQAAYNMNQINQLAQMRYDMARKDVFRMTFFMVAGCVLIILWIRKRINLPIFSTLIILLLIIDLWTLDRRFTSGATDPIPKPNQLARTDPAANFLKTDSEKFRILPSPASGLFQDNVWTHYRLESIGGYHAAKLRVVQDMFDYVLFHQGQLNTKAIGMLNGKYFLEQRQFYHLDFDIVHQGNINVYRNKQVLPRAFFVDRVKVLSDAKAIFDELNSPTFDPARGAILETTPAEFQLGAVDSLGYAQAGDATGATVSVTDFDIHHLTLSANTSQACLLVVSEIHYPPGWNAYIDGQKTPIYKTNYAIRSIYVPAGEHTIEFRYEDKPFEIGFITMIISVLFIGGVFIWEFGFRKRRQI